MGSKERRERVKLETRQLILDAARTLFTEKGFEAVTMRMIAQKIEYSPTAIYLHFADKVSLMRELAALDFHSLTDAVLKAQRVEDPLERLRRCGRAYVKFAIEHPNPYRLLFMSNPPESAKDVFDHQNFDDPEQSAYAMLRENVRYAIEQQAFREDLVDADQLAQLLWSGLHGLISLQMCVPNDGSVPWRPVKKNTELMMDILLKGFAREKQVS
jgi:AcrR family transcriptional regulator